MSKPPASKQHSSLDRIIPNWGMTLRAVIEALESPDDTVYSSQRSHSRLRGLAWDGYSIKVILNKIEEHRQDRLWNRHASKNQQTIVADVVHTADALRQASKAEKRSSLTLAEPGDSKLNEQIKGCKSWRGQTYGGFLNTLIKSERTDRIIHDSAMNSGALNILRTLAEKRTQKEVREGIIHFIEQRGPETIRYQTIKSYHCSQQKQNPSQRGYRKLASRAIPLNKSMLGGASRLQNPQPQGSAPSSRAEPVHWINEASQTITITPGARMSQSQSRGSQSYSRMIESAQDPQRQRHPQSAMSQEYRNLPPLMEVLQGVPARGEFPGMNYGAAVPHSEADQARFAFHGGPSRVTDHRSEPLPFLMPEHVDVSRNPGYRYLQSWELNPRWEIVLPPPNTIRQLSLSSHTAVAPWAERSREDIRALELLWLSKKQRIG